MTWIQIITMYHARDEEGGRGGRWAAEGPGAPAPAFTSTVPPLPH